MTDALPYPVAPDELVVRYVLTKSWLHRADPANPRLKPVAFIPLPRIELSVFRIRGWTGEQVQEKGVEVAEEREANHRASELAKGHAYPEDKRCFAYHGRGEITVAQVRATELNVVPKEPPKNHADVVGWPALTGNKAADEAAQMVFALKLAAAAKYKAP